MRKKRTSKKKMSTGKKIAIGVAVAGGGYLAWEFLIKPMIQKEEPMQPETQSPDDQIQNVIDTAQSVPTNSAPKSTLSPIGTPANKINWGAKVYYGSKGAEVQVIQKLFNAIARLNNTYTIKEDGIFGNETLAKKRANFGSVDYVTPKQVYDRLQQWKANQQQQGIDAAQNAILSIWQN